MTIAILFLFRVVGVWGGVIVLLVIWDLACEGLRWHKPQVTSLKSKVESPGIQTGPLICTDQRS